MKRGLLLALLALLICCTAAYAENTAGLQFGDTGDEVLRLQTRLKELEYYNGPLSGTFAEVTRKAVKAVQAAYDLEQTGIADAATQAIIYGECYRPLEYGMTSAGVQRLQEALKAYGYYQDKLSEKYLKNTRAAVAAFQRDNGLEATGKADVKTLKLLYSGTVACLPQRLRPRLPPSLRQLQRPISPIRANCSEAIRASALSRCRSGCWSWAFMRVR